jgi:hypothetical protein
MGLYEMGLEMVKGLYRGCPTNGAMEYTKNILRGENEQKQENLKTLTILFAFQVLVPSVVKGLQTGWPTNGAIEYIKNILGDENGQRLEDLKVFAILFAFQALVPSATKLISYAASSIDIYWGHQNNILEDAASTPITPIDYNVTPLVDGNNYTALDNIL